MRFSCNNEIAILIHVRPDSSISNPHGSPSGRGGCQRGSLTEKNTGKYPLARSLPFSTMCSSYQHLNSPINSFLPLVVHKWQITTSNNQQQNVSLINFSRDQNSDELINKQVEK